MSGADAGELNRIFLRLGQQTRIGVEAQTGAGLAQALGNGVGRAVRVDADLSATVAEPIESGGEIFDRGKAHAGAKAAAHAVDQLARVGKGLGGGACVDDGEGQQERREGHIAAADVEQPGDAVGRSQYGCVVACLVQERRDVAELVPGTQAGEGFIMAECRREGRRRPIGPDRVDRIAVDGDEPGAAAAAGVPQRVTPD